MTMKALVIEKPGKAEVREVEAIETGGEQVLKVMIMPEM
jgi:hypothetical protein